MLPQAHNLKMIHGDSDNVEFDMNTMSCCQCATVAPTILEGALETRLFGPSALLQQEMVLGWRASSQGLGNSTKLNASYIQVMYVTCHVCV